MNTAGKSWISLATGMFLIMSAMLGSEALALKYEQMNGEIGLNKLIIAPVYDGRQHVKKPIDVESMEGLRDRMINHMVSLSASGKAVAKYEGKVSNVVLHGVDASYIRFRSLDFVRGGYWNADTDIEQGKVAVIDTGTARGLFGSYDVIGIPLDIAGEKYRIIGVVGQKASIINKLFDDGACHVYVPLSAYPENSGEAGLDELQIAAGNAGSVDNNEIGAALSFMTEAFAEYSITDYSRLGRQLHQKSRLMVFILGVLIEIRLFKYGRRVVLENISAIKDKCKSEYLQDILRSRHRHLLASLVVLIAILCIAVLIGYNIRFELYIPSKLVPDELIDLAFWGRLIETGLQKGLESFGHYRASVYVYFLRVSRLQNLIFVFFVPLGFQLLNSGYSGIGVNRDNIDRKAALLAGAFIAEVIIWVLLSALTGLPVYLGFGSLLILLIYVFIEMMCYIEEGKNAKKIDWSIADHGNVG